MSDNVIKLDFSKKATTPEVVQEPIPVVASDSPFQYDKIVEKHHALMMIGVMKEILTDVKTHGLLGEHHFYITFDTQIIGVQCPRHFKSDLTIVLQNQFSDLEITDVGFSVVLSFNQVLSMVVVPWNAILNFKDPSAGLEFTLIRR